MIENLKDDLETLYKLSNLRDRVKELREQGLQSLKPIEIIKEISRGKRKELEITVIDNAINKAAWNIEYEKWIASGNYIEAALLFKIQNHRDISQNEEENDSTKASSSLKESLTKITLEDLFPDESDVSLTEKVESLEKINSQKNVPVLTAARSMHALVGSADTVFSATTFFCYYRILREIYVAAKPDWTVGAARVSVNAKTSAFVTGECIRAIFGFENSISRTVEVTESILELHKKYQNLVKMKAGLGADHPLSKWVDMAFERMWLDCYIFVNPRIRQIAFHVGDRENELLPLSIKKENIEKGLRDYFAGLFKHIEQIQITLRDTFEGVIKGIKEQRKKETPSTYDENLEKKYKSGFDPKEINISRKERRKRIEKIERHQRTESAHLFALGIIERAKEKVDEMEANRHEILKQSNLNNPQKLEMMLDEVILQCGRISQSIHKTVEPTKRYARSVINRELANHLGESSAFDAGELVFAATTYGAMTNWSEKEKFTNICTVLENSLPATGKIPTNRPFKSNQRGYRMLPIGCEMTRSCAQLFQKTKYDIKPQTVARMLNMFEENLITLDISTGKKKFVAWNFDGAPNVDQPCVWVTSVAVLSLDRMVRMLNSRINEIIYKHFDVIYPEKPRTNITLNGLIYSDYGFENYFFSHNEVKKLNFYKNQKAPQICLEEMRSHIMRSSLPIGYDKKKSFSAILYGPPGTGKSTFAEALAASSKVPVIRLSPSDLTVQGQELMEGRARDVFEALSMLTQVVIIFDEFEAVLQRRDSGDGSLQTSSDSEEGIYKIARQLEKLNRKDDPRFKFLLGSMLTKILKLYDSAKKNSVTYFLATNYLSKIDDAAQRPGRFDLKIPIYNPSPLCRAGTFLYRLIEKTGVSLQWDQLKVKRFLETIAATGFEPASELAFILSDQESIYFNYILEGVGSIPEAKNNLKDIRGKITKESLSKIEKLEGGWLSDYEDRIELQNNSEEPVDLEDLLNAMSIEIGVNEEQK